MNPRFTLAAGALALAAAFPVCAADQDSEKVIVTATRFNEVDSGVAANVSVITRQDIRNTPAQSLPDVLATRAGIDVTALGGGALGRNASADMRGFGATATSNTLILVDGLRINPVDAGTVVWSSIPLASVERIEIIRGSGTVLYGDGASGGVINIVTNKSGRPVAALTAAAGSYGHRSVDVQLANGNDKAYYNLFVNHAAADGYRQNGEQDQSAASGRIGWLLERGEVFADFATYKESAGQAGAIFTSAFANDPRSTRKPLDFEKRDGYRLRPGVAYRVTETLALEGEAAIDHQVLDSHFPPSGSRRVRDTLSLTPRLRWAHGLGALNSETVFGFDHYDGEVGASNSGFASQGASQTSSAFYAQNVSHLTRELALTLGARTQRMQQEAHQDAYAPFFSPAFAGSTTRRQDAYDLGLAYTTDAWRVYGKTGTTFRFANLDELFGFDNNLFIPFFAGDLKPQHGRINEVGGSVALGRANLRASLYRLDLSDEIGYDGTANVNLSPTRRQGVELEGDWKIADRLSAKGSYAYTDASFRAGAFAGKDVPLVARHQASAQLTWNSGATGVYSASLRRVGKRTYGTDFANAQGMLAGYTTLDLQSSWDFKPIRLTARLLNATDKKYASLAGYSSFNSDHYYYPADRRALYVSARYDF